MTMQNVVVVGGSIAAVTAAEALRLQGYDGSITVLGKESVPPYTRVPLSKDALAGRVPITDATLSALGDDIEFRAGVHATGLDIDARVVHTDHGDIAWDGLVIATGARARRLAPHLRELVLRDLDDCAELRNELTGARTVLIVGGGFLGMEIASTAVQLGKTVTVVDREPALDRLLGPTVAARIRTIASEKGIRFHVDPGGIVLQGRDGEWPQSILMSDGRTLEADLIVSAVGDIPNVEWLAGSGIPLDGGVVVDSHCRAYPGVVAAGDVAAGPGRHRAHERMPSWTNAIDQARAAAHTLLHGDHARPYRPSHYYWTEQFGLDIKVCGPRTSDADLMVDDGWPNGRAALLTWGPVESPSRALAWNHHLRPAQLKRLVAG